MRQFEATYKGREMSSSINHHLGLHSFFLSPEEHMDTSLYEECNAADQSIHELWEVCIQCGDRKEHFLSKIRQTKQALEMTAILLQSSVHQMIILEDNFREIHASIAIETICREVFYLKDIAIMSKPQIEEATINKEQCFENILSTQFAISNFKRASNCCLRAIIRMLSPEFDDQKSSDAEDQLIHLLRGDMALNLSNLQTKPQDIAGLANYLKRPIYVYRADGVEIVKNRIVPDSRYRYGEEFLSSTNPPIYLYYRLDQYKKLTKKP